MHDDFKIISKERASSLIKMYFNVMRDGYMNESLKRFAQKKGYGQEVLFIWFQSDFDDGDDEDNDIPKELDDKHVIVELDYPAVDVNEFGYLDFATFYQFLANNTKELVREHPEKKELLDLLSKVKESLGV